jgi:CRISPR type III-B/RAMP module-associated protein Cmr3
MGKPVDNENKELENLDWLLLGGEQRLARLFHENTTDPFEKIPTPPEPPSDGPCLLKWILVSPAIFLHGSTPGWCINSQKECNTRDWPPGRVCLDLPGRAHLVGWCLGRPQTISGWDVVSECAKSTCLAVPAGSVYYFLCENAETARTLALKLHWKPRSDFYGEKGCGYGLVSFDVMMHRMSVDVQTMSKELFTM